MKPAAYELDKHQKLLGNNFFDPDSEFKIGDRVACMYDNNEIVTITKFHSVSSTDFSSSPFTGLMKPSKFIWCVVFDNGIRSTYNEFWLEHVN